MQKLFKLSLALAMAMVSGSVLAANPGVYFGAGAGYSYAQYHNLSSMSTVKAGSPAGRAFLGYNFNRYVGLEAGYNYLGTSTITTKIPNYGTFKDKITMQSADLVAKGYLPINDSGFNLYALGGGAVVHGTEPGAKAVTKVDPKAGLGVSYDIPNSGLTTSFEVARIQNVGTNNLPSDNTAMATLSYTFN